MATMAKKSRKNKYKLAKTGPLLLIALPGIIYLLINNYLPMFGVFLAFKDYSYMRGIFGSKWCGFDNFQFLFATKDAWVMTRNTLLYNAAFIILGTVCSIFLAILIYELGEKRRVKFFQGSLMLPNLLSWVVVGFIVYAFLNADTGFINNTVLRATGGVPVSWYSTPGPWPFILILVNCWKGVGYGTLIYIATVSGIDGTFYEAAALDGANKWQQITNITLPFLIPSVITLLLMSIGRIFYSDFGLFYQIPQNSGTLFPVTNTIDTYVYRALISSGGIGRSSAAGVFQSVVGFTLVCFSNWIVSRISPDNAIF